MTTDADEKRIRRIIEQIRAAQADLNDGDDLHDLTDDDPADDLGMLPPLIADMQAHVGGELLDCLDPELIGDFCLMSVVRNEGTGQLLRSLIESFMRAYSSHRTSDKAVQVLLLLEQLGSPAPDSIN